MRLCKVHFCWTHSLSDHWIPLPVQILNLQCQFLFVFKGRNTRTLSVLSIDVSLNVAYQVIYIQIMLLPNIILNFSSQNFKFWSEFLSVPLYYSPSFLLSISSVSSANLLSYFRIIQGTEETNQLLLDWLCLCLSAESWQFLRGNFFFQKCNPPAFKFYLGSLNNKKNCPYDVMLNLSLFSLQ